MSGWDKLACGSAYSSACNTPVLDTFNAVDKMGEVARYDMPRKDREQSEAVSVHTKEERY